MLQRGTQSNNPILLSDPELLSQITWYLIIRLRNFRPTFLKTKKSSFFFSFAIFNCHTVRFDHIQIEKEFETIKLKLDNI